MLCNITQNSMGQIPGGVPISHNALQHYPEFHGTDTWGGGTWPGPARGYPAWGVPCRGVPCLVGVLCLGGCPAGGYPARGYPHRVPPARSGWGVPCQGGTQVGYPPSQVRRGGTQLGQQKEYSLHGGRYASCVHAEGLSCLLYVKELKRVYNALPICSGSPKSQLMN